MNRLFPLLVTAGLACLVPLFASSDAAAAPRQDACDSRRRAYAPSAQDTFVVSNVDVVGKHGEMIAGMKNNIEYMAFVQFAMPADVPPDALLCEVQLELYCSEYDGPTGPGAKVTDLQISNANRKWDEDTLQYNGVVPRKVAPQWDVDFGLCAAGGEFKYVNAKRGGEDNKRLLDTVQGWLDGKVDNYGLIISPTRGDGLDDHRFKFITRDGQPPPPVGRGPRIVIYYAGGATPTYTPSASPTPSITPTPTETPIPSETPTPTETLEPSSTPTETATPTETPTPTATPSSRPVYLPIGLRGSMFGEEPAPSVTVTNRLRGGWRLLLTR